MSKRCECGEPICVEATRCPVCAALLRSSETLRHDAHCWWMTDVEHMSIAGRAAALRIDTAERFGKPIDPEWERVASTEIAAAAKRLREAKSRVIASGEMLAK